MNGMLIKVVRILLGLCIITGSTSVLADSPWVSCSYTNGQQYDSFYGITIQVGRNALEGDVVGPWYSPSTATGGGWECETKDEAVGKTIYMSTAAHAFNHTINRTLDFEGDTYTVYDSAVVTGLGYIARWRYTIDGKPSGDWEPLQAPAGVAFQPSVRNRILVSSVPRTTFNIRMETQIRFVQTAASIGYNFSSSQDFFPMCVAYTQASEAGFYIENGDFRCAYQPFQTVPPSINIIYVNGTCTTPDVTVTLPEVNSAAFSSPGTTAARKDFELTFNRCPAGWASISYTFAPTTSIVSGTSGGVVTLDASSSATGVGIQLLMGDNTPVTYNSPYPLIGYDTNVQNATYKIPMAARLYQIGQTVTPGTANSAVTFMLNYK